MSAADEKQNMVLKVTEAGIMESEMSTVSLKAAQGCRLGPMAEKLLPSDLQAHVTSARTLTVHDSRGTRKSLTVDGVGITDGA